MTNGFYTFRRTIIDYSRNELGVSKDISFTEEHRHASGNDTLNINAFHRGIDFEKGIAQFNENGWTSHKRVDLEGNLLREQSYEYHENGLLKSINFSDALNPENNSRREFQYESNRLDSTLTYNANGTLSKTETYSYDKDDRAISSIIEFESNPDLPSLSPLECEMIYTSATRSKKVECYRRVGKEQKRRHFSSKLIAYDKDGHRFQSKHKTYQIEVAGDSARKGKVLSIYILTYAHIETDSKIPNQSLFMDYYFPSE